MSKNNYNSLNYCLNLLYNYLYNKDNKECYLVKHININEIKKEDIISTHNIDYKNIFNNKFKYIKKENDYLIFKRYDKYYNSMIKIGIYNNKNKNNIKNDMKYHYLLSEVSLNNKLNFILLPIKNLTFNINDINDNSLKNILIKNFGKNNIFYTQIFEHYFKQISLEDYLKNEMDKMNLSKWKVLLFQIIYALHVLNESIPGFTHNDFSYKSIYLYLKKESNIKKKYIISNTEFLIPNYGFDIKIHNFKKSKIKKPIEGHNLNELYDSSYNDIFYFFHTLIFFFNETIKKIPKYLDNFIKYIVPLKFRTKNYNKFRGLDEVYYRKFSKTIINPKIILTKNNFFSDFIKSSSKMDSPISATSNTPKNINELSVASNEINTNSSQEKVYLTETDSVMEGNILRGSRKMAHSDSIDLSHISSESEVVNRNEFGLTTEVNSSENSKIVDSILEKEALTSLRETSIENSQERINDHNELIQALEEMDGGSKKKKKKLRVKNLNQNLLCLKIL